MNKIKKSDIAVPVRATREERQAWRVLAKQKGYRTLSEFVRKTLNRMAIDAGMNIDAITASWGYYDRETEPNPYDADRASRNFKKDDGTRECDMCGYEYDPRKEGNRGLCETCAGGY